MKSVEYFEKLDEIKAEVDESIAKNETAGEPFGKKIKSHDAYLKFVKKDIPSVSVASYEEHYDASLKTWEKSNNDRFDVFALHDQLFSGKPEKFTQFLYICTRIQAPRGLQVPSFH